MASQGTRADPHAGRCGHLSTFTQSIDRILSGVKPMKSNNIDLTVLGGVLERGRQDPAALKMVKRVEGTWNFAQGAPAFTATVAHGQQTSTLHGDVGRVFGGAGLAPDPLQYMLRGLGSSYAGNLVTSSSHES